jgi:hypothetical protein
MAAVAALLDRREHRGKVDGAFAGAQVLLVRATAVGDAHLPAALHVQALHELVDAVGADVRVIDGEAPAERGRVQALEVVPALLDVVREVVHFGLLGLGVQVLEQQLRLFLLR